jgi:hypothetical protein
MSGPNINNFFHHCIMTPIIENATICFLNIWSDSIFTSKDNGKSLIVIGNLSKQSFLIEGIHFFLARRSSFLLCQNKLMMSFKIIS